MKNSFKLSVIMPVYNEKNTIREIIHRVLKQKQVYELIAVDDHSKDGTTAILDSISRGLKDKRLRILTHSKNAGKGAAIRTGLKAAAGNFVIIQDADLEYDPADYPLLVDPVISGKAEVVYGSRFYGGHRNMLFWHKLANDILNLTLNILFDTTISDCETGYKLMPVNLLKDLKIISDRFDFEIEATCKILKRGIRIYEVPISYTGREYKEGKKIKFRDAVVAFSKVWLYRFI